MKKDRFTKIRDWAMAICMVLVVIWYLLFANYITAQAQYTVGISTEWADKNTHNEGFDYGFNIGGHIEYQHENRWLYLRARTFYFPELNNIPYFDFDGGGGLNWRSWNDVHRIYLGAFTGVINRKGWGHPKVGLEVGYDLYWSERVYSGIRADTQYKYDNKSWGEDGGHNVKSISFIIGYKWI